MLALSQRIADWPLRFRFWPSELGKGWGGVAVQGRKILPAKSVERDKGELPSKFESYPLRPVLPEPMLWLRRERAAEQSPASGKDLARKLEDGLIRARSSSWLAAQPPAFVNALLAHASYRPLRRGQVVIELNESGCGLYFLLQGAIDVSIPRLTNELFPVHFLPPYRWFGEPAALTGKGSCAEYRARMPGAALYVPRAALQALQIESAEARQSLLDLLTLHIRELMEITGDLAGLDPGRRVISKLLSLSAGGGETDEMGSHAISISQSELAAICCVSRPSINLFLGKLEKAGLLRLEYRRILILRRQDLIAALNEGKSRE